MSNPTLSRVTMETMANYRTAAAQVVAASGAGSRRFVRAVDGTLQSQLLARATKVVPQAGERFDEVRGNVSRLVEQGIAQVEKAAEATIERSSDFAVAQITRFADLAADVRNPFVAEGLHTAARLTLPAAQLVLMVSGKVAVGATSLADAAGAHPVAQVARKAVRRTRRAAAPVVAAAEKPVKRARKQAEVQVKAVVRRARKAQA